MTSITQKLRNDATLLVESAYGTWSNAPYDNLLTVLPILIHHKIICLAIYLNAYYSIGLHFETFSNFREHSCNIM